MDSITQMALLPSQAFSGKTLAIEFDHRRVTAHLI
jgi:hypothetical protein